MSSDLDKAIEERFQELRRAELDEGDEPLNEESGLVGEFRAIDRIIPLSDQE